MINLYTFGSQVRDYAIYSIHMAYIAYVIHRSREQIFAEYTYREVVFLLLLLGIEARGEQGVSKGQYVICPGPGRLHMNAMEAAVNLELIKILM